RRRRRWRRWWRRRWWRWRARVLEADTHTRERRRHARIGCREVCLVTQVAEPVELVQARAAGGEEGRGGAVGPDEAERARSAVAPPDLEPDGGARGRGRRG